jgi:hypothetical protein
MEFLYPQGAAPGPWESRDYLHRAAFSLQEHGGGGGGGKGDDQEWELQLLPLFSGQQWEQDQEKDPSWNCKAYVSSSCESSPIIQEEVNLSLEVLQDLALTPEMWFFFNPLSF